MMSKFVDKVAVIVGAYFRHKASGAENGRSFYAIVTRAENEIASNRLLWALLSTNFVYKLRIIAMAIAGCGPRRVHEHRRWLVRVVAVYREHRISCSMPPSSTSWWSSQRRRLYARPRCHCTITMHIHLSLVSGSASGRQCARERHRKGRRIRVESPTKGSSLHTNLCSVTRQGRRK